MRSWLWQSLRSPGLIKWSCVPEILLFNHVREWTQQAELWILFCTSNIQELQYFLLIALLWRKDSSCDPLHREESWIFPTAWVYKPNVLLTYMPCYFCGVSVKPFLDRYQARPESHCHSNFCLNKKQLSFFYPVLMTAPRVIQHCATIVQKWTAEMYRLTVIHLKNRIWK